MPKLNDRDLRLLRRAIELSAYACSRGNQPYGALLANAVGTVQLEAENTQVTDSDCTGHAELNLLREASRRFGAATLTGHTVYASGEPRPMCAGAIYWSGVGRVVYALSVRSMAELAGEAADELQMSCAEVLSRGSRVVQVDGPALEDEARRVFDMHVASADRKGGA